MSVNMPSYDWESHEALTSHIRVLDKILLAFQRQRRPDDEGSAHVLAFLKQQNLVKLDVTKARPHVDVERLSQKMVRDALYFSDQCAARSHTIVGYLNNICTQFGGGPFADKIDGEISMRQMDLQTIHDHIKVVDALYGPVDRPYYDRTFHNAREGDVELAQFYYQELVQNHGSGLLIGPETTGLSSVFNLAGRQLSLAKLTQRYASAAITLSDNVAVLLSATASKRDGSTLAARNNELHAMAESLLLGAVFALDEAAQLARESYTSLEVGRPVFRSEPKASPTRQFPGYRQP